VPVSGKITKPRNIIISEKLLNHYFEDAVSAFVQKVKATEPSLTWGGDYLVLKYHIPTTQ
jgi:hypothetical protein